MKKAAVCTPLPGDVIERLEKECEVVICGELKHGKGNVTEEQTKEECMGCEIIVLGDEVAGADTIKAWADAGMKFIGVAKGTPVTVDFDAIQDAGLELSYTPGRNRVAVAEFCIGLMLAESRKLAAAATGLRMGDHLGEPMDDVYDVPDVKNVTWGPLDENHPFNDYGIGFELYGKKLGIAGYGAIGREVAVRAKAFGMEILAYDPYMPAERIEADGATPVDLDTMLSESDVVSIHLPVLLTGQEICMVRVEDGETELYTQKEAFSTRKRLYEVLEQTGGSFMQISKSCAVNLSFAESVEAGFGGSLLLKMKNVTLTPHIAGLTTDVDNWSGTMMGSEVVAYLDGAQRQYLWKVKK